MRLLTYILFLLCFPIGLSAQTDSTLLTIKHYVIEGNKKTKAFVIERESGLPSGTKFPAYQLETKLALARININNLQHFNSVEVKHILLPEGEVIVLVEVTERWYLYPIPILEFVEPNFNVWWKNKDFSRTNIGLRVLQANFRGRDEQLEFVFKVGFTQEFGVEYSTPYLNKKGTLGLKLKARYAENDEFNYGTYNNQRLFFTEGDGSSRTEREFFASISKRPTIYTTHSLGIRNGRVTVADSLLSFDQGHLLSNNTEMNFMGLEYSYNRTKVDRTAYPLTGTQVEFLAKQDGLGILKGSPAVFTWAAVMRSYIPIKGKFYFQNLCKVHSRHTEELPYYLQEGLGYNNNAVRGYEFYVIDGQRYALMRNNIVFEILPMKEKKMNFIKSPAFNSFQFGLYASLIGDLGYVEDELYSNQNPLSNELMAGSGLGLDFLFSYDMIFRLNYSMSRYNDRGIYFHFKKSI